VKNVSAPSAGPNATCALTCRASASGLMASAFAIQGNLLDGGHEARSRGQSVYDRYRSSPVPQGPPFQGLQAGSQREDTRVQNRFGLSVYQKCNQRVDSQSIIAKERTLVSMKTRSVIGLKYCPKCGERLVPTPREIKDWRQRAELTQREMAMLLGVSVSFVALLESGRRSPSANVVGRFWRLGPPGKR
jgi:DNA-binding transcriptional regulator YiaG